MQLSSIPFQCIVAFLIASAPSHAASLFSVSARAGGQAPVVAINSATSVTRSQEYLDFDDHALSIATAEQGRMYAESFALCRGAQLSARASADFSTSVLFTKTDPSAPDQFAVSLNLDILGQLFGGPGYLSSSVATLEIAVGFLGHHQASFKSDYLGLHTMNPGGFENVAAIKGGYNNALLVTPEVLVTIGQVPLSISLATEVSVSAPFFDSSGSGNSSFSSALPIGTDVFNLPPGYTANASNFLVNNRYIPVPEPGTWCLVVIGLLGLIAGRVSAGSNAIMGATIA